MATATTAYNGLTAGTRGDEKGRPSRLGQVTLAAAGVFFVGYPALRPYSDETTLDGAAAMASTAWVVAHVLGMAAFVLLAFGLSRSRLPARGDAGRPAALAAPIAWLGVVLVLPYYGAEAFGVQVIARRALEAGDASLLELVDQFRMGSIAITMFGAGLVALAIAGIALVLGDRHGGPLTRLGRWLCGAGLVLYLPQFYAAPTLRIGHGIVLGAGLVLLAASAAPQSPRRGRRPARRAASRR